MRRPHQDRPSSLRTKIDRNRKSQLRTARQAVIASAYCTAFSLLSTPSCIHAAQQEQVDGCGCPPGHDGWAAGPDCASYFWCTAGYRSSITYECLPEMEFHVESAACERAGSFDCATKTSTTTTTEAPMRAEATVAAMNMPTPYPTTLGPFDESDSDAGRHRRTEESVDGFVDDGYESSPRLPNARFQSDGSILSPHSQQNNAAQGYGDAMSSDSEWSLGINGEVLPGNLFR